MQHSLFVSSCNEEVYLFGLDSKGEIKIRVFIAPNFAIRGFHYHSPVPLRDLLGFQPTLKYSSQLDAIIVRCNNFKVSLQHDLSAMSSSLSQVLDQDNFVVTDPTVQFVLSQIEQITASPVRRRYDIVTLRQSALIYFISSSAYTQLRTLLPLPHQRTLRTHLAGLGEVGTQSDSEETIRSFFLN